MTLIRYISHAEVAIDAAVPVPEWGLTDEGRRRVEVLAQQPWVESITRIVTSQERKAVETAAVLAGKLGVSVERRAATGETDRSATGFLAGEEYEEVSALWFGQPQQSIRGWERAIDAQRRIVDTVSDLLVDDGRGDVAIVGHGGVGTLLWCHLVGAAIDAEFDQPHPGHLWTYDRTAGVPVHDWWPIDRPDPPLGR